jgi:hypothetical protein
MSSKITHHVSRFTLHASRFTHHASRITHHLSPARILVGIVVLTVLLPLWAAHAAPLPLPPLPLPPDRVPPSTFTGGFIQLQATFPQTWPWDSTQWEDLWTVVQWQDEKGTWRDVEGWQGSLDEIVTRADGTIVGHKTWWVARGDLGKGPFRWRIYRYRGGWLLATSSTFDLPSRKHATTAVEIAWTY